MGGLVAAHLWLLRLSVACLGGMFVVLPVVSATFAHSLAIWNPVDSVLAPAWVSPLVGMLTTAVTALIGALVMTFCAIYDARLFMTLSVGQADVKGHRPIPAL